MKSSQSSSKTSIQTSLRYGGGNIDARSILMRIMGFLQRKPVIILRSDPQHCAEILASSSTKGTFLEHLIATPAWHPIYSIESMDGARWEQLASDFKKLMGILNWRERLVPLTQKYSQQLLTTLNADSTKLVDGEAISRLVLRIFYELLFNKPISTADEDLFYQASLEWRREIAVKARAKPAVKNIFWQRLKQIVSESDFNLGLTAYADDNSAWLSLFAQPFLLSPQINISDIMVGIFNYLPAQSENLAQAITWAQTNDHLGLAGIIFEAIRLNHPFPILEREVAGTQYFILLDQFEQDPAFKPQRWRGSAEENSYHGLPFAAGPRMCIGKPIAMELMVELLKTLLLKFPRDRIQPQLNHLYSGRDNDSQASFAESVYQLKIFIKGLWRSFLIGRGWAKKSKSQIKIRTCPWHEMSKKLTKSNHEKPSATIHNQPSA